VEAEDLIIVGDSEGIRRVQEQIERVAPLKVTVLISGESGTGKELVARKIHARSARRSGPLVPVNCASIPEALFESEFFGHVRGAFTGATSERRGRFELADGGTLFLDEVGEVPPSMQAKLLRVLQEGTFERVGESRSKRVDVRVVAATNRDLAQASRSGTFRSDLYYRLSVYPIVVPPLRERVEDIGLLVEHHLQRACARLGLTRPILTTAELTRLERYPWPGNVRELQNLVERALIAGGEELGIALPSPSGPAIDDDLTPDALSLDDLALLERRIIVRELERSDWQVYGSGGAATRLGIPATTLASRMKRLGITKPRTKPSG